MRRRSIWKDESGAELIEFAIVFPLLLLVMLGIIDFGLLFQRYEVVTNAAREGARVATLPGYADEDVTWRVEQYLDAAGLTDSDRNVTVGALEQVSEGGNCIWVRPVVVTYPHGFSFVGGIASYFGGSITAGELTATAKMRPEIPAFGCP